MEYRMRRRIVLIALLVVAAAIYLLNASWLAPVQSGKPVFLAHRGVHQTYAPTSRKAAPAPLRGSCPRAFLFGKHTALD